MIPALMIMSPCPLMARFPHIRFPAIHTFGSCFPIAPPPRAQATREARQHNSAIGKRCQSIPGLFACAPRSGGRVRVFFLSWGRLETTDVLFRVVRVFRGSTKWNRVPRTGRTGAAFSAFLRVLRALCVEESLRTPYPAWNAWLGCGEADPGPDTNAGQR